MKNVALYKRYSNIAPVGVCHFSNCFGVALWEPDNGDKFECDYIAAWANTEGYVGFHRHKVHYSTAGRAYIRKGTMRIYLDNVMRV